MKDGRKLKLYCWRCLEEHKYTSLPLFKVKNSWVFACEKHKDLEVPMGANSLTYMPDEAEDAIASRKGQLCKNTR